MIKHAWDGYARYAMGANDLMPVSKKANPHSMFGSAPLGATLIDSLDTLYIAELMEEFDVAKKWVKDYFDISKVIETERIRRDSESSL